MRSNHSSHCKVIPRASIGIGIFQAASLQAAATIQNLPYHECQHSVFDNNEKYLVTNMECQSGQYIIPDAPGLGVEPSDLFGEVATLVAN
jgi:galactonate dehydratase